MLRVPLFKVNWPFWVRSSRALVKKLSAKILIPTNRMTASARAQKAYARREIMSAALAQIHDQHVRVQEQADQGEKENQIAKINHTGSDGGKMHQEAEGRHRFHQRQR